MATIQHKNRIEKKKIVMTFILSIEWFEFNNGSDESEKETPSIRKRFDEIEIKISSKWNRYSDFSLSSKLSYIQIFHYL